jgi:L,D-peptidoglycan transpeptidase YkuD (ErfK/YbiS/YcfS/YnhG family)
VVDKWLLVALGAAGAALLTSSTAAQATDHQPRSLPLAYHGKSDQVVTVVGGSPGSTTASLTAWQHTAQGWVPEIGPVQAYVGSAGIGKASETSSRTPAGTYSLTEAFGTKPSNGTRLPYRQVDSSDWWVSDVSSPHYNTHQRCAPGSCGFDESAGEDLGTAGKAYEHATVIDYNRDKPVAGAGSAFFLHVATGEPTAGCVAVPAGSLDAVMRWLDPAEHPVIDIGVH